MCVMDVCRNNGDFRQHFYAFWLALNCNSKATHKRIVLTEVFISEIVWAEIN